MKDKKINVVVAEASPVILSGFAYCLRKIDAFDAHVYEVKTEKALISLLGKEEIDIVMVNPTFGGNFSPLRIKEASHNKSVKIIAIELSKLNNEVVSSYDATISVTDEISMMSEVIKNLIHPETSHAEDKELLSSREKEIIALVAKGLTNQEIADTLFLSIHTVMTHRRNIARKLEIHSATGLTIYAIVNKIVEISDIKL